MLSEAPDVDDALDRLRRDTLAVERASMELTTADVLPNFPRELEVLLTARNQSLLAAAASGASIKQMAQSARIRSATRTRQMLDRAATPDSARTETLSTWGRALRRQRVATDLNLGQLAVLALLSRADVVALEGGDLMPTPEQGELLRAALSMSPQNRSARLRVLREQQVHPRPLQQTGGRRSGPLSPAQREHVDAVRELLTTLQPLIEQRDDLLSRAQQSGVPMTRIAAETGLTAAEVRRNIDAARRREESTRTD